MTTLAEFLGWNFDPVLGPYCLFGIIVCALLLGLITLLMEPEKKKRDDEK